METWMEDGNIKIQNWKNENRKVRKEISKQRSYQKEKL